MTPYIVVASTHSDSTAKQFYNNGNLSNFSRIPVYQEHKEYIKGYVLRSSVLNKLCSDKGDETISDIIRPILFFNESENVSSIWETMIAKKEHISVITDEYGCMRGIVTMEDVIETMLGVEIVDEHDEAPDMQELAKTKFSKFITLQHVGKI